MAAKEYLPWVRGLAALDLRKEGISESRIASYLGVTQPSVALYLKRDRRYYLEKLAAIGLARARVEGQVAAYVDSLKHGGTDSITNSLVMVTETLASGALCDHHRSEAGLPEGCDVCMRFFGAGDRTERSKLLRELSEAEAILEASSTFPALIPEVFSNFVCALPEARTEQDVAGFPGRIAKVLGRARATRNPEFGVSRHTAGVLLAVKGRFNEVNSCINVLYDDSIGELVSALGWKRLDIVLDVAAGAKQEAFDRAVRAALGSASRAPDIMVHTRGMGLEASAYVFGSDPVDVVDKALSLADVRVRLTSK